MLKKLFLGVLVLLMIAGTAVANNAFDNTLDNGGVGFNGLGLFYGSDIGLVPHVTRVWVGNDQCVTATVSGVANVFHGGLICPNDSDFFGGADLSGFVNNTVKGYCIVYVMIDSAETSPVSESFGLTIDRDSSTCP